MFITSFSWGSAPYLVVLSYTFQGQKSISGAHFSLEHFKFSFIATLKPSPGGRWIFKFAPYKGKFKKTDEGIADRFANRNRIHMIGILPISAFICIKTQQYKELPHPPQCAHWGTFSQEKAMER